MFGVKLKSQKKIHKSECRLKRKKRRFGLQATVLILTFVYKFALNLFQCTIMLLAVLFSMRNKLQKKNQTLCPPCSPRSCPSAFFLPASAKNKITPIITIIKNIKGINITFGFVLCATKMVPNRVAFSLLFLYNPSGLLLFCHRHLSAGGVQSGRL